MLRHHHLWPWCRAARRWVASAIAWLPADTPVTPAPARPDRAPASPSADAARLEAARCTGTVSLSQTSVPGADGRGQGRIAQAAHGRGQQCARPGARGWRGSRRWWGRAVTGWRSRRAHGRWATLGSGALRRPARRARRHANGHGEPPASGLLFRRRSAAGPEPPVPLLPARQPEKPMNAAPPPRIPIQLGLRGRVVLVTGGPGASARGLRALRRRGRARIPLATWTTRAQRGVAQAWARSSCAATSATRPGGRDGGRCWPRRPHRRAGEQRRHLPARRTSGHHRGQTPVTPCCASTSWVPSWWRRPWRAAMVAARARPTGAPGVAPSCT